MQEQNRLAMGADFWLAVPEHPGAGRLERGARGANVAHLVADVVNAAVWIALEKFGDWRAVTQGFKQFDFRIRQSDKHGRDAVVRLRHGGRDIGAEHVAVQRGSLADIPHRNGDVVELADQIVTSSPRLLAILYDDDVHMADRFFAPALGDDGADRPSQTFGNLIRVPAPRL